MNILSNRLGVAAIVAMTIFSVVGAYFLGREHSKRLPLECSLSDVLKMEALTTANQVDGAVSALSLLEQGDLPSAKNILESQVISGLAVLLKLSRSGSTDVPPLVPQTIDKGKRYAKQHDMVVPE